MNNRINELLEEIFKIPNKKIITLALNDGQIILDVNRNNQIGYAPNGEIFFKTKIATAMHDGGGLIIREFLPLLIERIAPNGKKMWLPEKNIYGVSIGKKDWFGLNAQDVRLACETDPVSGESLPKEKGVHYKTFPTINLSLQIA